MKGDRAGQWSVRVSGNWRVVFRFEDGEAVDVEPAPVKRAPKGTIFAARHETVWATDQSPYRRAQTAAFHWNAGNFL
ncbi:MAG: hypothetical protein OXF33_06265 [Rhodospirillales bacterium]|nr:hypothetical protein [Rhodospirillales bacterium]